MHVCVCVIREDEYKMIISNLMVFHYQPSKDKPDGDYSTVVKQDSGDEVLVVQAFAYGKYFGFLQLEFDDTGKVPSWAGQAILFDKSVVQGGAR